MPCHIGLAVAEGFSCWLPAGLAGDAGGFHAAVEMPYAVLGECPAM